ncbi:852_t:CDS:2 [Paraglomus brasilianum]|uniref:852_t:CDS:1 n=1 Tax=Paraglomus brasilianum TaxID=144538 RepID=A0A9N9F1D0_9GLOM|nr:852_t:CDS:2 [Paraglomus brasilianum]
MVISADFDINYKVEMTSRILNLASRNMKLATLDTIYVQQVKAADVVKMATHALLAIIALNQPAAAVAAVAVVHSAVHPSSFWE